jgi:hypothetical protein
VGKENNVSDQFGEKVNEAHVRTALANVRAEFLLVACEGHAYTLYVEAPGKPDIELQAVGEKLEEMLQGNPHYRYCRNLGQLEHLQVFRITSNGHVRYLAAHQARGRRLGDVKPTLLERHGGWSDVFQGKPVTAPIVARSGRTNFAGGAPHTSGGQRVS